MLEQLVLQYQSEIVEEFNNTIINRLIGRGGVFASVILPYFMTLLVLNSSQGRCSEERVVRRGVLVFYYYRWIRVFVPIQHTHFCSVLNFIYYNCCARWDCSYCGKFGRKPVIKNVSNDPCDDVLESKFIHESRLFS